MSQDNAGKDDGFLSRWSRRKIETKREAETAPAAEAVVPEPSGEAEEELDLSLLPKPEDITASSDITMFLKKGVPDSLRNAALRQMWVADPAIRDYVGLADFQWDFNALGAITGYGELAAGTDVAAMVTDVAEHHLRKVVEVLTAAPEPAEATAISPEMAVETKPAAAAEADEEAEPPEPPVMIRRRHGGATPV